MFWFKRLRVVLLSVVLAVCWGVCPPVWADLDLERVQARIQDFRLDNGMTFIVMERHTAPTVWLQTYVNVGGVNEVPTQTGIAHFFEHLAFKGTSRIGAVNSGRERQVFQEMDHLDTQLRRRDLSAEQRQTLLSRFDALKAEAASLVQRGEFDQIVSQAGGTDLNAFTSKDSTQYVYNFPSNKLELWFSLESERFWDPVFREFYEERQVIQEERRNRIDNSPTGSLFSRLLSTAFEVHPYRYDTIGSEETIQSLTREQVQAFYHQYYTPHNMTFAIVGDVDPAQVKQLAQTYFGRFRDRPSPPDPSIPEPPQSQPRQVVVTFPSQPLLVMAYHRPAVKDPDDVVYSVLTQLLSDGRTSRLYRSLVTDQHIALSIGAFNGYPGEKFPHLLMIYGAPSSGHTLTELQAGVLRELERIWQEPLGSDELTQVQTHLRADLLGLLRSNQGMAGTLLDFQIKSGDWRHLFQLLDQYGSVTEADIQRVAKLTFRPQNQTVGSLLPPVS